MSHVHANDPFDSIELCGALTSDLEPWATFVQNTLNPILSTIKTLRDANTLHSLGLIISAITRRGHYVNLATTIAANGVAPRTHANLTAGSSILNAIKEHSRALHDVLYNDCAMMAGTATTSEKAIAC